ncbi:Zn-dependent protease [Neolewinella xylanilytica]|uniref:Zn-dependent protease n=1 Tax=Neolewinella xylanilytica TaxID=1514080 RepID=A0A2S6IAM6_9BACT|nr:M50 family metallopeptidase [Neolewinella xylanilytica]PPK88550.1 Zn-dependent protease [Neolewinella xylanilytica]
MFATWRIGRIFGVPTELHWSFVLVPLAILFYAYQPGFGLRWTQVQWWSGITLLLFFFVLIHELGHALTARARGIRAEKIILFPLGGGALIPDEPERTRDQVLIYAAGPLANLLVAALALLVLVGQPNGAMLIRYYLDQSSNLVVMPALAERLLGITLAVNVVLALGNLLPAYPLDGGRILRALLKRGLSDRAATVITTVMGITIGAGLIAVSYFLGDPLLGISSLFIIAFSAVELNRGWQRRRLTRSVMEEVLRPSAAGRIYVTDRVSRARAAFALTDATVLPVYNNYNELSGFVEKEVLQREGHRDHPVRYYYEAEFITARPTDNLLELTERIVEANVYGAAIYDGGEIVGFVFTEDVIRLLDRSRRRFYKRFRSPASP